MEAMRPITEDWPGIFGVVFWFGLVWFDDITTNVGYLMPNPLYTYTWYIYIWFVNTFCW